MQKLNKFRLALAGCALVLAAACDQVKDLVPDVQAPIEMNFTVNTPTAIFDGLDTLDPNKSSDYRDNKGSMKNLAIDQITMKAIEGTFDTTQNRLIKVAEASWAFPDSANFHSLGKITNKPLKDFRAAQQFPASKDDLNKLAQATLNSPNGIKFRYHFEADSAPLNFGARAKVYLVLKLN